MAPAGRERTAQTTESFMSNVVTTLLDFILDLLRDPKAAADYAHDPDAAIANAGLTGVTQDDVSSAMGMVPACPRVRGWEGGVSTNPPSQPYAPHHEYQPHQDYHPQGVEADPSYPQPEHCQDDGRKPYDDHKPWDDHGQGQEMAVIQHVTQ